MKVVFNIAFTPSKPRRGASEIENARWNNERKFYNLTAKYNYVSYSLNGVKTAKNKSILNIVISGDGAQWIQAAKRVIQGAEYHIDKFHIQKAVTQFAKGDLMLRAEIFKAVKRAEKEKLANICKNQLAQCVTNNYSERRSIIESYLYLQSNLENYVLTDRCSAEGHVSHVLSARLSSRPMGWSIDGANRMAALRAFMYNGGNFDDLVRFGKRPQPTPQFENISNNRHFWGKVGVQGLGNAKQIAGREVVNNKCTRMIRNYNRAKTLSDL